MQRNEPHWLLTDADANRYGAALANALRHMPIKAAQKTIDYSTFAMMVFIIETPRIAKSVQIARQAPAAPPRGPAQVFQFRPQAPNASPPSPPPPAATTSPPPSPAMTGQGPPPDFAVGPQDGGGFGGDDAA